MGIVSLHDPPPAIGGYFYVKYGIWFRLMHDLTCAPFLALYLSALGLIHWRLLGRGRQDQRSPLASWMALVFALFGLVYTMSTFTPVRVFGEKLAMM